MKKVIIIANEKKSDFNSKVPTIFHKIIDKPMIKKIVDNFESMGFSDITTIFEGEKDQLEKVLGNTCNYVQANRDNFDFKDLTPLIEDKEGVIIISYGNIPLISKDTYTQLLSEVKEYPMVVLTADNKDSNRNRIIRDSKDTLKSIVRFEDANSDQLSLKEVNMNVYAFNNKLLYKYLNELDKNMEYYSAGDLVHIFKENLHTVYAHKVADPKEASLIQTRMDLANANKWEQYRINEYWLNNDVTILDSESTIIGDDVIIGLDTIIHSNTSITGKTIIGKSNAILKNCTIDNSIIEDNNKIEQSKLFKTKLGSNNDIGPWTNLREHVEIGDNNRIGTNVELKNSKIQSNNALAHNVYLGDTTVGNHCNIGWGVVTANYNGISKSKTIIGDNCFVGSSSTIIAPVTMGDKVLVAAGSTVNKDIADGDMAIARVKQENKAGKGRKYIERVE